MSQESNYGKRSDAFERALRQTVRQSLNVPGAVCPEPEMLAAYFERSLSSAESAEWEKHFSVCGRCQQQLAALARSELVPGKPSVGWAWIRSPHVAIRWLAPALVALGSVALWIAIQPTPSNLDQIARESSKPVAEGPERSRGMTAPTSPVPEKKKAAPASSIEAQANQPLVPKPAETPKKGLAPKGPEPVERDEMEKLPTEKGQAGLPKAPPALRSETAKNEAAPLAAAPPIPAPLKEQNAVLAAAEEKKALGRDAIARQEQERAVAQPARQPEGGQQAPPTTSGLGGVRANASQQKSQADKLEGALAERPLQKQGVSALAPKAADRFSTPVYALIPAPGGTVIWRIGIGGRIQRSLDGGKIWEPQTSGVQADLTNGHAASATVCWLVGTKGTVLRTTDGLHWQKIAFPLEADLSRVDAPDPLHAVITTADGQTYATEDGGQSWQKR